LKQQDRDKDSCFICSLMTGGAFRLHYLLFLHHLSLTDIGKNFRWWCFQARPTFQNKLLWKRLV